jgi:hypothetical protein
MSSSIYLIEAENGLVKIGRAQIVGDRVQACRVHSPLRVRLIACWPGAEVDEAALHERFRAHRQHGEWFNPEGEFGAFVARSRGIGVDAVASWDDLRFSERNAFRYRRSSEARAKSPKPVKASKQCPDRRLGLTKQQARALQFISGFVQEFGWSPSYQELANELGLASKSGVHRIIHGLVDRGYLALEAGSHRAIVLPERQTAETSQLRLGAAA